ncbi:aspartate aminotransferase family protein [Bacilliculturomica massiliensis]|uniref:aspartate aminotransferase family protein n=1 Tax=Bacilliculturomica massiliensis TaxID=1917867 RepID=UPI001030B7C5|nr:aspartate aminotransferase family protein [Bacilliculturomica massiliensis]
MKEFETGKSKALFEETKKYLVDGAGSSFHKAAVEEYPICMTHGRGSKLYDVDGNEYIDYVAGFGPMILGYSPDCVNEAVKEQIGRGSQFSATTPQLCRLSKKLTEIIPSAEMVSFQSSGTEANMHAFRVARAYTGRNKIVKFEGQYHGWSDEQKITIGASDVGCLGPRNQPWKLLGSAGQRAAAGDDLIIAPWNDLEILENIFIRDGQDIAAVITEPYMCDEGPIMPREGYLNGLRQLTKKYNILLIFDEVITGFRMALGGAQQYFGVTPDMSVFGKAIAAGYSLSMVCGSREIMSCGVHPSGTFNANPIAVAASLAAIEALSEPGFYQRLERLGLMLAEGIVETGKKHGLKIYAAAHGGIVQMQMGIDRAPLDFRDVLQNVDSRTYNQVFLKTARYGVRITSSRGRIYISAAHTEEDIQKTLAVFDQVFSELN